MARVTSYMIFIISPCFQSQDEGGPRDTHPGADDPGDDDDNDDDNDWKWLINDDDYDPGRALGPLHPPLLRVRPPAPAGEGGRRGEARQGGLQRRRLLDPGGRGDDGDDDDDDDDQVITTLLTLIAGTIVRSSNSGVSIRIS